MSLQVEDDPDCAAMERGWMLTKGVVVAALVVPLVVLGIWAAGVSRSQRGWVHVHAQAVDMVRRVSDLPGMARASGLVAAMCPAVVGMHHARASWRSGGHLRLHAPQ